MLILAWPFVLLALAMGVDPWQLALDAAERRVAVLEGELARLEAERALASRDR